MLITYSSLGYLYEYKFSLQFIFLELVEDTN